MAEGFDDISSLLEDDEEDNGFNPLHTTTGDDGHDGDDGGPVHRHASPDRSQGDGDRNRDHERDRDRGRVAAADGTGGTRGVGRGDGRTRTHDSDNGGGAAGSMVRHGRGSDAMASGGGTGGNGAGGVAGHPRTSVPPLRHGGHAGGGDDQPVVRRTPDARGGGSADGGDGSHARHGVTTSTRRDRNPGRPRTANPSMGHGASPLGAGHGDGTGSTTGTASGTGAGDGGAVHSTGRPSRHDGGRPSASSASSASSTPARSASSAGAHTLGVSGSGAGAGRHARTDDDGGDAMAGVRRGAPRVALRPSDDGHGGDRERTGDHTRHAHAAGHDDGSGRVAATRRTDGGRTPGTADDAARPADTDSSTVGARARSKVRARHGRVGSAAPTRKRRGPDRKPRVRRDHIGALALDVGQERIMDRVNREYADGTPFVPTERDRRIWDYLALFRFATRRDAVRVGGWSGEYALQAPRLRRYGDLGLIEARRIPLSTLDYVQLTHDGMDMSSYPFLSDPAPTEATRGDRSHSLGLSSLSSQLLAPDPLYSGPGHDLLGLGDDGWASLRAEIADGDAKVIGETIYRSAWSRMRSMGHAGGRAQTALTDPGIAGTMASIFRRWKEGHVNDDTMEWVCCDPEYQGEYAWLWMIYGGDSVRGGERDGRGRPRHVPRTERAVDEKGKIIRQPGDSLVTRDHPPDMVIARHRDRRTGRPRSIAVELELTGKSTDDYRATMSAYMSDNGRILYDRVVWLVIQGAVANMIRSGANWAGAVEGRDYAIVPVTNEEGRTRDAFYDGMDMRPGVFDTHAGGGAYGYAIARSAVDGLERDGGGL